MHYCKLLRDITSAKFEKNEKFGAKFFNFFLSLVKFESQSSMFWCKTEQKSHTPETQLRETKLDQTFLKPSLHLGKLALAKNFGETVIIFQ